MGLGASIIFRRRQKMCCSLLCGRRREKKVRHLSTFIRRRQRKRAQTGHFVKWFSGVHLTHISHVFVSGGPYVGGGFRVQRAFHLLLLRVALRATVTGALIDALQCTTPSVPKKRDFFCINIQYNQSLYFRTAWCTFSCLSSQDSGGFDSTSRFVSAAACCIRCTWHDTIS